MNEIIKPLPICLRPETITKIKTPEKTRESDPINIDKIIEFLYLFWLSISILYALKPEKRGND